MLISDKGDSVQSSQNTARQDQHMRVLFLTLPSDGTVTEQFHTKRFFL